MLAVYKREMRAYFTTLIGYVFIAVFMIISGWLFLRTTMSLGASGDMTVYYELLIVAFAILIPLLTMKLFADEKKLKTEVLLLTSPVSLFGIVMAKYLAAVTMFVSTFAVSCINLIPLYKYGTQNTKIILCSILADILVGCAFIAVGVFMSALTENQLIAAITTIAAIAFLCFAGEFSNSLGFAPLRLTLNFLSVMSRFEDFMYGRIDWSSLIYYFSISFIFIFLTVRVYERRRWA